jgi:hypothetical protein
MRRIVTIFVLTCCISTEAQSLSSWNFKKLRDLVNDNVVTDINSLIPLLPEEIRTNPIYVYDSKSLQGASPMHPRVILKTRQADFMMTFNGLPSQRGYKKLEIIEFNHAEARFEFKEIEQLQSGGLRFNEKPDCTTCHQGGTRPNWDPYPFWPGVYGSINDQVFKGAIGGRAPHPKEARAFEAFLRNKPNEVRYRSLIDQDGQRRNELFTLALSKLNRKRIYRSIEKLPAIDRFRPIITEHSLIATLKIFCRTPTKIKFRNRFKKWLMKLNQFFLQIL